MDWELVAGQTISIPGLPFPEAGLMPRAVKRERSPFILSGVAAVSRIPPL